MNPYEPCVANKTIEGSQMTTCFHVDDCKLSQRKKKVNDRMIEWLRQKYESVFEDGSGKMTVSRGKVHECLGMRIDFSIPRRVQITMFDNVEDIITAFEKACPKLKGAKSTAAPDNLFKVNDDCEKLPEDRAVIFHNLTAKTLFTTKRARPDTCTLLCHS